MRFVLYIPEPAREMLVSDGSCQAYLASELPASQKEFAVKIIMMMKSLRVKPFHLFRWFSLVSLVVILMVSIGLGVTATRFLMNENLDREAVISAQFIQSIAEVEIIHSHLTPGLTMGDYLDKRVNGSRLGVTNEQLKKSHEEFFDHIVRLPDVLLANVYSSDGVLIWSTNPQLMVDHSHGKIRAVDLDDLDKVAEAVRTRKTQTIARHGSCNCSEEAYFAIVPQDIYLESYIPLLDNRGTLLSVIEIYKEPTDLFARLKHGFGLLWLYTVLGGAIIYLSLFWFVRHASRLVEEQQLQLVENESLTLLGEMSTSVAHSLRNPLACIRSSAELALEVSPGSLHKYLSDVITQVDRMSKWVRELLLSSHPLTGDQEPVNLTAAIEETLIAFEPQLRHTGIKVDWGPHPSHCVVNHPVLLQQLLSSVVANAIEAMPHGGLLSIRLAPDARRQQLALTISDTGSGMSPAMLEMAFKPFHSTKRGGLGVGLLLVRRIVERFGGTVSIDSQENAGTNVHFIFKASAEGEG